MTSRDIVISGLLLIVLASVFFRPPWQWTVAVGLAVALVFWTAWWFR